MLKKSSFKFSLIISAILLKTTVFAAMALTITGIAANRPAANEIAASPPSYHYGSQIYDWTGAVNDDWNLANNWSPAKVPGANDIARVGTGMPFINLPVVHRGAATVTVGAIIFGNTCAGTFKTVSVTVNAGYTLNINGDITLRSDAQSYHNYPVNLTGAGIIKAVNLNILTSNTAAGRAISQVVNTSVNRLILAGNITLTTDAASASIAYNSSFNLLAGTVTVGGYLKSVNSSRFSVSTFNIAPVTAGTLQLNNSNALSNLSALGANIVSFNNDGATVEYSGAAQTIYTHAGITGLSNGVSYKNLSFSGTGIKTPMSGNLNISGNFTNTLANDALNYADLTTPTINFTGNIVQTIKGGPGNGTTFYNLTFSGAGTKKILSGKVNIASTGVLTMKGTDKGTVLNANGLLTLNSDASGSAAVAAMSSGPAIIGDVNVQRFFRGGSTYDNVNKRYLWRNYRIISSAVNTGTQVNGNYIYGLNYIVGATAGQTTAANSTTNAFVTGATGGSTSAGTPSVYLYRENKGLGNFSFNSGNYVGITDITTASALGTTDAGSWTIPVGNGVLFFFRGAAANWSAHTVSPYIAPENVTLTSTGTLNQGSITVRDWYTPASSNLGYTGTAGSLLKGFNMLGNPYACTIDLDKINSGGITATNIDPTIYVLNPKTNQYDSFSTSTHIGSTPTFSGKIASGQGFFVKASNSSATFTFNEACKAPAALQTVAGGDLYMGAPVQQETAKLLRLKLLLDSANFDDIIIGFKSSASAKYSGYEDARDLGGLNATEGLSSMSADAVPVPLAINFLPLPKQQTLTIPLSVHAAVSGQFTLKRVQLDSLPKIYEVWLMDKFMKDSLDLRNNKSYVFNIDLADTSSYGNNRFSIVIRQNKALGLHLLDFTAVKATDGVQVAWKTENEENYTNFTVERSTDNGVTFDVLGGFLSSSQSRYNFTDKNPAKAVDIYHLKMEDLNGSVSYSKSIALTYGEATVVAANNINVYPNPAVSTINLAIKPDTRANLLSGIQSINKNQTLQASSGQSYAIKIVNVSGNVVKSAISSQPSWQDDIGTLLPGTYIIQVLNNTDKSLVGKTTFVKM